MIITLSETHVHGPEDGLSVFYNWTLQSGKHFWFKRISRNVYLSMLRMLPMRCYDRRILPPELLSHSRTGEYRIIHEIEFFL